MKKLEAMRKVLAAGLTFLITVASGLLSLPSLRKAFADQIGWLHDHLSSQQATAVGGVLLALGLSLLYLEVRDRGLKPRKGIAAMGLLWVISSLGLIFFAPNHLSTPEEVGIGPAEALTPKKDRSTAKGPQTAKQGKKAASPGSTETVALIDEGSSNPQASPSATPSSSTSTESKCTCPSSSPAPAPSTTRPAEETTSPPAEEERQEEAAEAREEEQEAAEEAREEAEFAREEEELGI